MPPLNRLTWTLGRRVERLLVVGSALVALAFVAFYLAYAARHYVENRTSVGMENLALLIEGDDKVLLRFYELEAQRQKLAQKKKDAGSENFYLKALEDKVSRAAALSGADPQALRALLSENRPPADLVKILRERKRDMDERPATVAGVVVPNGALWTRLPAAFVANMLIIALGPLIIFWLGALHATRVRERAASQAGHELYPHALNADRMPLEDVMAGVPSRRWPALASTPVKEGVLAFVRMALLALLVVPMIASYVAAVTTLGPGSEGAWLRALYAIVVTVIMVVQAAALLLAEGPPRAAAEVEDEDEPDAREEPRMTRDD